MIPRGYLPTFGEIDLAFCAACSGLRSNGTLENIVLHVLGLVEVPDRSPTSQHALAGSRPLSRFRVMVARLTTVALK